MCSHMDCNVDLRFKDISTGVRPCHSCSCASMPLTISDTCWVSSCTCPLGLVNDEASSKMFPSRASHDRVWSDLAAWLSPFLSRISQQLAVHCSKGREPFLAQMEEILAHR